ncbi:Crp/Fnr family transcriptional regulator [Pedobacter sp. MW01-1-1]|uniref:Crp/Fnr family transcriptional regulator n=1 Tax=Pedobacter sp. MW01-1-1 TaxID=3383027 RepID=UPI003FF0B8A8
MELIKEYFESIVPVSNEDVEFLSKMVKRKFPKNSNILKQGNIEGYLSFIEKGSIRFHILTEEKDNTFAFGLEGSFVSAYDSFLNQSPCEYSVTSITETILWSIKYADLQDLYNTTAMGDRIGRMASEGLFKTNMKKIISLLNESAEDRYLKLMREEPQLLQTIPLKYIASYIGVTPEALSRIRKRIIS